MKKEIRYENYYIDRDAYTVKLTHLPQGGVYYNPVVHVQVMKWHVPPRNLWERITERWKYNIDDWVWDPIFTEASLDSYCICKCGLVTAKRIAIERGNKEWKAF